MSRRSVTALDRLLGQLAPPEIPADLAPRIVAKTTRLAQHQPREAIIAAMPPPHRTLGQQAVGQRLAGLGAFAAAACLVMLMLPLGTQQAEQQPVAIHSPAVERPPRPEKVQPSPQLAAVAEQAPSKPAPGHKAKAPDIALQPNLAEAYPAEPVVKDEGEMPHLVAPVPSSQAQVAEVEGPRLSVQGPPTPIELAPAGSRAKTGLGVVAGTASTTSLPRQR